jgi:hypothetical protein
MLFAILGLAVLALGVPPAAAQSQQPLHPSPAARGNYDSYKSDLGPPSKTGDCAQDKLVHNNAGANAEQNYDTAPSNTVISSKLAGPSTGAARNDSYLTNGTYPGFNPFGVGGAKFASNSGSITTRRASASAKDSDTVNSPCGATDEGTLN